MTTSAQDQRPRFYEGQYLGADDLSALVTYLRTSEARHALGGHTWGIAIGLQLTEKSTPGADNRVEVTLQPGFGWDGFGRAVFNGRPTKLTEDLFASIPYNPAVDDTTAGGKGRLVAVWLAYDEIEESSPQPGFETCAVDDQYERTEETFRFEIGKQPVSSQRSPVTIGTASVDALKALTTFDSSADQLYDTSVPQQEFPFDGKPPKWLIPIGYVRWIARDQALGYFADRNLDPNDKASDRIRAFRRYVGTVAEYIEAADGAIVLHHRGRRPDDAHLFGHLLTSTLDAKTVLDDLVWVEGNLRVVGQAKLAGGDLLFRDADGDDEGTPFYIARRGDNPSSGNSGNRELRIVIGPASQNDNRLVIGSEQPPVAPATSPTAAPYLVVVSSGNVGIGTASPATSLEVVGNWNNTDGAVRVTGDQPTIRFEGGAPAGNQKWIAQVGADDPGDLRFAVLQSGTWQGVLYVTPNARVGVGTPAPTRPLGIRGSDTAEELVSFEDAGGTTKWHINQKLGGNNPGLNIVETGVDDGRLFFKPGGDTGIGTVTPTGRLTIKGEVPQHGTVTFFSPSSDFEYDGGSDALYVFKHLSNGITSFTQTRVGIGSTTPYSSLAVRGYLASEEQISFEDTTGTTRWHFNTALASAPTRGFNLAETGVQDGRLFVKQGGNVGISTTDPQEKLHVAGTWLRVDGPNAEQAVLGSEGNGSIVLGTRNATTPIVDMRRLTVPFSTTNAGAWLELWCSDVVPVSDERAKTNITSIEDALKRVSKLRGVSYDWKGLPRTAGQPKRLGLIAQEVAKVVPEAARIDQQRAGVSYSALIPLLVEAVKELKAEVDALRGEVKKLGSRGAPPKPKSGR